MSLGNLIGPMPSGGPGGTLEAVSVQQPVARHDRKRLWRGEGRSRAGEAPNGETATKPLPMFAIPVSGFGRSLASQCLPNPGAHNTRGLQSPAGSGSMRKAPKSKPTGRLPEQQNLRGKTDGGWADVIGCGGSQLTIFTVDGVRGTADDCMKTSKSMPRGHSSSLRLSMA